jgi:hypothetical protein
VAKETAQEEAAQEEPMRTSSTVLMYDMPVQAEMVAVDAPLDGYCAHAEVPEALPGAPGRAFAWTWWCAAQVLSFSGAGRRVKQYKPLGPRVRWIQGLLNWGCRVTQMCRLHLSARGRWKAAWSRLVRGLWPRTCCCGRRWLWLARTSCAHCGLVKEKEKVT